MKEYMILLYASKDHSIESVPEAERGAIYQKFGEWVGGLVQKKQFISGDPLSDTRRSMRDRGTAVVDGPFIESKEVLNGYFLIRAADLNEATELCKNHPCFLYGGGLEVVEMAKLDE